MKRLRIVSDGTVTGTTIYIINENGGIAADISSMVKSVFWERDTVDKIPGVTLSILSADIDLIGELKAINET